MKIFLNKLTILLILSIYWPQDLIAWTNLSDTLSVPSLISHSDRFEQEWSEQQDDLQKLKFKKQRLKKHARDPQLWYELGELHFKLKQYDLAEQALNRALRLRDAWVKALFLKSQIFREQKQWSQMREVLNLVASEDSASDQHKAQALNSISESLKYEEERIRYEMLHDSENSNARLADLKKLNKQRVYVLNRAIELNPQDLLARSNRAEALMRIGYLHDAAQDCEQTLELPYQKFLVNTGRKVVLKEDAQRHPTYRLEEVEQFVALLNDHAMWLSVREDALQALSSILISELETGNLKHSSYILKHLDLALFDSQQDTLRQSYLILLYDLYKHHRFKNAMLDQFLKEKLAVLIDRKDVQLVFDRKGVKNLVTLLSQRLLEFGDYSVQSLRRNVEDLLLIIFGSDESLDFQKREVSMHVLESLSLVLNKAENSQDEKQLKNARNMMEFLRKFLTYYNKFPRPKILGEDYWQEEIHFLARFFLEKLKNSHDHLIRKQAVQNLSGINLTQVSDAILLQQLHETLYELSVTLDPTDTVLKKEMIKIFVGNLRKARQDPDFEARSHLIVNVVLSIKLEEDPNLNEVYAQGLLDMYFLLMNFGVKKQAARVLQVIKKTLANLENGDLTLKEALVPKIRDHTVEAMRAKNSLLISEPLIDVFLHTSPAGDVSLSMDLALAIHDVYQEMIMRYPGYYQLHRRWQQRMRSKLHDLSVNSRDRLLKRRIDRIRKQFGDWPMLDGITIQRTGTIVTILASIGSAIGSVFVFAPAVVPWVLITVGGILGLVVLMMGLVYVTRYLLYRVKAEKDSFVFVQNVGGGELSGSVPGDSGMVLPFGQGIERSRIAVRDDGRKIRDDGGNGRDDGSDRDDVRKTRDDVGNDGDDDRMTFDDNRGAFNGEQGGIGSAGDLQVFGGGSVFDLLEGSDLIRALSSSA